MDASNNNEPESQQPNTPPAKDGKQEETGQAPAQNKAWEFPTAYTVLIVLTILIAILTWIIPSGSYQKDTSGKPIPGSYHQVAGHPQGVADVLMAPINGMYALADARTGLISVETPNGSLFGAINVALFILVMGGFITMALKTGAITAGIGSILHRFRDKGYLLIPILMIAFGLGGTTFGMAEETLGFFAVVIAILLALGYDAMTGYATVTVGAALGVLASTLNPFATGVASGAAGISTGNGFLLRALMWIVLMAIGIIFVMRYAARVKADPARSIVADQRQEHMKKFLGGDTNSQDLPAMTTQRKLILLVFVLTFLIMIYTVIPWDELGITFWPTLDWGFGQFVALFAVGAVVIGLIARFSEKDLVNTFVSGASDFLSPALVVAVARGIAVLMYNGLITDTILHSFEGLLTSVGSFAFADLMYILNLPLAFLIPSTSGHATLAMPILAPLADFAHVPRAIVVTAYQSASGTINLFTPTSSVIMGGLTLSSISYDRWIRFLLPLLISVVVVCLIMIGLGSVIATP